MWDSPDTNIETRVVTCKQYRETSGRGETGGKWSRGGRGDDWEGYATWGHGHTGLATGIGEGRVGREIEWGGHETWGGKGGEEG